MALRKRGNFFNLLQKEGVTFLTCFRKRGAGVPTLEETMTMEYYNISSIKV